jgi:hypothetical protein
MPPFMKEITENNLFNITSQKESMFVEFISNFILKVDTLQTDFVESIIYKRIRNASVC